jgi:hypothetical protein
MKEQSSFMFPSDLILIYQSGSHSRALDKATLMIGSCNVGHLHLAATPVAEELLEQGGEKLHVSYGARMVSIDCTTHDWRVSEVTTFTDQLLTLLPSHWCSTAHEHPTPVSRPLLSSTFPWCPSLIVYMHEKIQNTMVLTKYWSRSQLIVTPVDVLQDRSILETSTNETRQCDG